MPIKVPDFLPAKDILTSERIFVIDESRAYHQDIRPLKIGILNLMPLKETTEVQLLRLLGNTPLQVEIDLLRVGSYTSKNTSPKHLESFYKIFSEIEKNKYDGFIITGAPVELLEFKDVQYWEEVKTIMEWSKKNVTSTLHICWGAQAGLYYHFGIDKIILDKKKFGIFPHTIDMKNVDLLRGFDNLFYVPHSRHTGVNEKQINDNPNLQILASSKEAGVNIISTKDGNQIFVLGHSEYDPDTLKTEYLRDVEKGVDNVDFPENYFPEDDISKEPIVNWRSHGNLLFSNWLNYYVYQATPFSMI